MFPLLIFFFSKTINKMNNKLKESQIEILSNNYCRRFDVWEAWGDLCNALAKHCDK